MKIEQFEDKNLAHYSYAILSKGEMAVIDPARNPEPYLNFAKINSSKITAIIETHPHADFVSSHLELAHTMGYISGDVFARVSSEADRMNRLINGYIAYLKRSRQGENEPGAPNRIKDTIEDYSVESDIPSVLD